MSCSFGPPLAGVRGHDQRLPERTREPRRLFVKTDRRCRFVIVTL